MSRATIRAAVTAYLDGTVPGGSPINGVDQVLRAQPRVLQGKAFGGSEPGRVSGAVLAVMVEGHREVIEATDGAGGARQLTWTVAVQVLHRSVETDAAKAMDDFDAVMDGLCLRMRSDPTLGLGWPGAAQIGLLGAAVEWLETQTGEPSIEGVDKGGAINTWGLVRFPVIEWQQAT